MVLGYCTIGGYRRGAGKLSAVGIAVSIVVMLLAVYLGNRVDIAIAAVQELDLTFGQAFAWMHELVLALNGAKAPAAIGHRRFNTDDRQRRQIARPLRFAVFRQQRGMGAGDNAHRAEPGRHHAAISQFANPYRQIDMVVDQIGITVAK